MLEGERLTTIVEVSTIILSRFIFSFIRRIETDILNDMKLTDVLILEDDQNFVEAMQHVLSKTYRLVATDSVDEALSLLKHHDFKVAVVDDLLPRKSGLDFIREAKKTHPNLPIVMVTAEASRTTAIECVNLGVKRFLEKPISLKALRESLEEFRPPRTIQLGSSTLLLTEEGRVETEGKDVGLTPIEFKIVEKIALAAGNFVSRRDLNFYIWKDAAVSGNALDTHLSSARKKLGEAAHNMKMARGKGYRWENSKPE
jgi:two-component system OmpR family response regulator